MSPPYLTDDDAIVTPRDQLSGPLDDAARQFVLWSLRALGRDWSEEGAGIYQMLPTEAPQGPLADAQSAAPWLGTRFCFDPPGTRAAVADVEPFLWDSPLAAWFLSELQGAGHPLHAQPAHQPGSVHELAGHLFSYYQVDGGHAHLAGCTLDDRPFLRLTLLERRPDAPWRLLHVIGSSDGTLIEPDLHAQLELDALVPMEGRKPRLELPVLQQWIELTERERESQAVARDAAFIAATVIWCKYACVKLSFAIGDQSVELAFEGWGRLLESRRVAPPPYTCPLTGEASYHLTSTDDGRITVAPSVAVCAHSGRRVLAIELRPCAETGQRVLPEYLTVCPVSGHEVLESTLIPCSTCRQAVSAGCVHRGQCAACRGLERVQQNDTRLARLLQTYPRLEQWPSWKGAQTATVHIWVAQSTWTRLLLVVDAQTLQIRHLATGRRWSQQWRDATPADRADWVG